MEYDIGFLMTVVPISKYTLPIFYKKVNFLLNPIDQDFIISCIMLHNLNKYYELLFITRHYNMETVIKNMNM